MAIEELNLLEFVNSYKGSVSFGDEGVNKLLHKGRLRCGELLFLHGTTENTSKAIDRLYESIDTDEKASIKYSRNDYSTLETLIGSVERLLIDRPRLRVLFLMDSGPLLKGFRVKKLEKLISEFQKAKVVIVTNFDLLASLASQTIFVQY